MESRFILLKETISTLFDGGIADGLGEKLRFCLARVHSKDKDVSAPAPMLPSEARTANWKNLNVPRLPSTTTARQLARRELSSR